MLLKGYLASISLERSGCMFGVASSARGGSCSGFFNVDNVYNGELIPITPPPPLRRCFAERLLDSGTRPPV